jgi:hypothetical protein
MEYDKSMSHLTLVVDNSEDFDEDDDFFDEGEDILEEAFDYSDADYAYLHIAGWNPFKYSLTQKLLGGESHG